MEPKQEITVTVKGNYGDFDVVWDGSKLNCRGCGLEIGFATTKKNKRIPIDIPDDENSPVSCHFDTCEKAEEFRTKKDKK